MDILLTNASVLDARQGTLLPDRHVSVKQGKIVEVSGKRPAKSADLTIDLKGRTLMPGLIDGHVHVTAMTADIASMTRMSPSYVAARASVLLRDMLMRGFTTVRDVAGCDFGLADAVDEGYFLGPRVIFGGRALSQTGGHGDVRGRGEQNIVSDYCCVNLGTICDGVAEVRRAAREEIRRGAKHIKLMVGGGVASPTDRITSTQFSLDEITAAVEEAEAATIYCCAHAYTPRAIQRALSCGVRSIEHGNLMEESNCELFVEKGAYYVATLSTYDALATEGIEAGLPAHMHAKVFDVLDAGRKALEMADRKGVKIVYGTDLLGVMQRHQLREFAIRGEIQKPADVLRGCTVTAAELINMPGQVGMVAPGAFADMIVVDGNPLDDLGVMQNPDKFLKLIMKMGQVVKNEL
jgi:imidazolonepropionase-like amidohydrolase